MTRARDRLIVCGAQYGTSKDGEAKESWRARRRGSAAAVQGAGPCETPFGEGVRLGAPVIARGAEAAPFATVAMLPAWVARTPVKTTPRRDRFAVARCSASIPRCFHRAATVSSVSAAAA